MNALAPGFDADDIPGPLGKVRTEKLEDVDAIMGAITRLCRRGAMYKLAFEPTGALLEAGVLACVPALADPRDPSIERPPLEEAALVDFCLSQDGSRLVTATTNTEDDATVSGYSELFGYVRCRSRSGTSWSPLWTVRSRNFDLRAVAFLPDSTRVLVVEENIGRDPERDELPKYSSVLTVRDAATGELITENFEVRCFDDLQQSAVADHEPVVVLAYPHELYIHKVATDGSPRYGIWSPGWWRRPAPEPEPHVIRTEWPGLSGLAFHPSGRFLLTVSGGPGVAVWDTETWTVTRQFNWQTGNLCSVGMSGNGLVAAVGSDTGVVTIWDWEA